MTRPSSTASAPASERRMAVAAPDRPRSKPVTPDAASACDLQLVLAAASAARTAAMA